ncbi:MAG: cardiolipin synthase [Paenibacillaceae bacterium]|nr:cardiolipin synthase [Paenibacillaceae bacterium]
MFWLVIILVLFIFQIATILVSEFRRPEKAVAWLSILFILPVIGFVMYYFLAKNYTQRRRVKRKTHRVMKEMRRDMARLARKLKKGGQSPREIEKDERLFGLLSNLPGAPITICNEVEFYHSGAETYDAILQAMEEAKDHIHVEYYTIREDGIGLRFQDVMIRKAREGVAVRLLYDGVGSMDMTERYIRKLQEAGVRTGCFLPPLIAFIDKRLNYRNHRKIVVVDGIVGFLGGINVGDEYLGKHKRLGYWRDTHMKMTGDAVYYLQHTFIKDWFFVKAELLNEGRYLPEHDCQGREMVQIVNGGPDAQWDAILEVYFSAITTAQNRVYITTPYFIPDSGINMALKTAAISGVDVRIILPSVPDTRIVYLASMSFLEELLQAGVRFYLYEKGFIHAKMLIVDEKLATVGTANMDMRSFFSNFEQNAVLFDRHLIRRLELQFRHDLKESREVILAEFERRSRWQKGKEIGARLLSPLF